MGKVLPFPLRRHVRTSSQRKNASIGTAPPETSLSRFAKLSDASLRPAKMLRRCDGEQPPAAAKSAIVLPLSAAQRSIGCDSLMGLSISTRNDRCQPKIFPSEIGGQLGGFLQCVMPKTKKPVPREIFLGEWLNFFGMGPTKAAKIAGCDQSYISNIKGGRRENVNALYLLNLSEHFGITVNDFFHRVPPQAHAASFATLSPQAQQTVLERLKRAS